MVNHHGSFLGIKTSSEMALAIAEGKQENYFAPDLKIRLLLSKVSNNQPVSGSPLLDRRIKAVICVKMFSSNKACLINFLLNRFLKV
jgi:hypothetical protein